jgi:hypothetical protein
MLTTEPVLTHLMPKCPCFVETDIFDLALVAVLIQKQDNDILHPIAYHTTTFPPAEINYKIQNKELGAIIDSFKIWQRYLEGALLTVLVYINRQYLE